ncbi:CYTH domain-containing protein [Thalassotalea marina]|uniref:Inorganic triphosphatase n=1 Tax=Thalassotalea marina TaxID=1673741 RepID=A0A919BFD2_9GAMM|nr:CYTH and CHAD domain-containing protein [Thalassotalea marina]GHF85149.1 inorganic triphosphatase [Thalassotalea marina]
MSTEVELKYLILSEDVSKTIKTTLEKHHITYEHSVKQLNNCYFDTPELALRLRDIGLRIRSSASGLEQTIKTSGRVVGGLHQRPEYNVDIKENFPNLSLFPTEIWQSGEDITQLQAQLISLFTTNFTREVWLLNLNDSKIEMAYDRGTISAAGDCQEINELELELVSGNISDLFVLADILFHQLSLRAGIHSKAARGYRLFGKIEYQHQPQMLVSCVQSVTSAEEMFVQGVNHYLMQLQQSIEQYLQSEKIADLAVVVDILSTVRHGLWLFNDYLTETLVELKQEVSHFIQLFSWVDNAIFLKELMNKTGNYRKKLEYSEQLIQQLKLEKRRFPDFQMTKELMHSERFNQLQLALLNLVVSNEHSSQLINNVTSLDFRTFAQQQMDNSLRELTEAMSNLSVNDAESYLAQRNLLHRCLLTGNWFGFLFEQDLRHQFRAPWIDMELGLRELQSLWIIHQQLDKLDVEDNDPIKKIQSWQQSKVDNLMLALSHTKDAALMMPVYWRD